MPQVNGQHYRQAGAGYRAEKNKMAAPADEGDHEATAGGEGSQVHVMHHGGGDHTMKLKHPDGHVTKHEHVSREEMHQKIDEHFGHDEGSENEQEPDGDEYESEGGDALKNILG